MPKTANVLLHDELRLCRYDLFLFDPVAMNFTVDRYLADLKTRYGGVDAVLLWPTFPQASSTVLARSGLCPLVGPAASG